MKDIFRRAEKAIDRKLTSMSTCPGCHHPVPVPGCKCLRTDCACGTAGTR
jgi:hypothetical protein